MATKMKMVNKGGKMVPAFAADGKGKMKLGGVKMKKMGMGGMHMQPEASMMKKGGAVKKYQDGGKTGAQLKKEGQAMKTAGAAMKLKGKAIKKIGSDIKPKTGVDGLKALTYHVKNMGVYKMQDGGRTVNTKRRSGSDPLSTYSPKIKRGGGNLIPVGAKKHPVMKKPLKKQ